MYIAGELELTPAELEARKAFVQLASQRSFYFFAKQVLGFKLLTNQTHRIWCKELQAKFLGMTRFMRLKPRGTYKTTLYGIGFLLWVWAVYSHQIRFLYTSANESLLDEVSAELDRFVGEKSESLYALVFGIRRDPRLKNTADVFNLSGKEASKGASLMFRTAGGSTNGVHPHFIIVDDPMDIKDRTSPAVRKAKEIWFDSLTPLLVPYVLTLPDGATVEIKKVMFIATRWHLQDLVAYIQKKNPEDWDFETEGVYREDGSIRYPELLPEAAIAELRRHIADVFFSCQYNNNPLPEGSRIFAPERLHYLSRSALDLKRGSTYCFLDPAKGVEGGDWPAVVWLNVLGNQRFFFQAIDQRHGLKELLDLIALANRDLKAKVMVFETNGAMGLEHSILASHQAINYPIQIAPIHETANKPARIESMQPDLYNGSWFFLDVWEKVNPEMRNQIVMYPAWGNDDFPDVVEKAISWVKNQAPGSFGRDAGEKKQATLAGSLNQKAKW